MVKGVFTGSLKKAKELNAERYYWDSHAENILCKKMIELMILNRYDGQYLRADCAQDLCNLFGAERVGWVLANSIQQSTQKSWIGIGNLEWASHYLIPTDPEDRTADYCVRMHGNLVGDLAWQLRSNCIWQDIADYSECVPQAEYSDYTNKLAIIAPGSLKDVYRTRKYQYFYVEHYEHDFDRGETIIQGRYLMDGRNATLYDCNILGVADEKALPDEVTKKLAKFRREYNAKSKAKEGTNENQGISDQSGTGSLWHTVSELRRYVEARRANRS